MNPGLALSAVCLALLFLSSGCSRTMVKQGGASLQEFTVGCPRDQVFDQALAIAQRRNLEVKVLEKSSGFIRFERTPFGPEDLDTYFAFPLLDSRDGQPISTYQRWTRDYGEKAVGTVNLNLLLTEVTPSSTRVSIRGNWGVNITQEGNSIPSVAESTGALEKEIERDLVSGACGSGAATGSRSALDQLKGLRDRGLITEQEFQKKRRDLEATTQ